MSQLPLRLVGTASSHPPTPGLTACNPELLSDAELLACFLDPDAPETALPRAQHLLQAQGGLRRLLGLPYHLLIKVDGDDPEPLCHLALGLEIGRRDIAQRIERGAHLPNPESTCEALMARLRHRREELFACLYLDNRHHVLAYEDLFRGTIDGACVPVRVVVQRALEHNAAAMVFAHNHPSGDPEPSHADRILTRRLSEALDLVEVRVIDHIVVGANECVSFAERGWL